MQVQFRPPGRPASLRAASCLTAGCPSNAAIAAPTAGIAPDTLARECNRSSHGLNTERHEIHGSTQCSAPRVRAPEPAAGARTGSPGPGHAAGVQSGAGQPGRWKSLFDGKTLDGWRGYKKTDAKESRWMVEDGMLTLPKNDGKDTRGARDIISTDTYDQFELEWEWKIALAGNSGVKYFVLEDLRLGDRPRVPDDRRRAPS